MFFLIPTSETRPSILEKNKDVDYHCKFARYCLGQANNSLHEKFLRKIVNNKRFYKGDQWFFTEDVDTFLKDDDNQDRNRLNIVQNVIRPMVEQYRGNAIRMNINFRVKSISPHVINRREIRLAEMLTLTKIANEPGNPFGPAMKKKYMIGDSEAETRAMFNNTYVDHLVEDMNDLARYVSNRNEFIKMQPVIAMSVAMTGLGVMYNFEYAGHQIFNHVQSENFFWDNTAKRSDLKDSGFMGHYDEVTPAQLYEEFPDISEDDKQAIDNYAVFYSAHGGNITPGRENFISNGKVPRFFVYWIDGQSDEYGYVKDEFGYERFTKINHISEGMDKPKYTDKDLIKSNSLKAKKLLGNKLKRRHYYDVLRMAIIIPREILANADGNKNNNKLRDVVLDWGIAPYQETESIDYNNTNFPYKCDTWAYVDGEVLSPIDDAIDPQRYINRVWSISENQLNNMPGTSTFLDSDMVPDQAAANKAMNQSKPVYLRAKGRGMQNAVLQFDGGSKALAGIAAMYNIQAAMKAAIKETTGVNDAIQGGSVGNGNDQLVGVTELMIQRGSLMQEPFYNSITSIFEQCFNAICTRGKRIYADNERTLTMAVGDDGLKVLRITKEMNMEDFRCFAKRENSDEILINTANTQLLTFLQFGMLDAKRVSNLWGRSNPDQVSMALREYAAEKEETSRMAQKDQAQKEGMIMQQAQADQEEQRNMMYEQAAREDIKYLTDKKAQIQTESLKALSKLAPKNRQAENIIIDKTKNLELTGI